MTPQCHPNRIRATSVPTDSSSRGSLWIMLSIPWKVLERASEHPKAEVSRLQVSFTSRSPMICDKSLLIVLILLSGHFNISSELFLGCAGAWGRVQHVQIHTHLSLELPRAASKQEPCLRETSCENCFSTTLGVLCVLPAPFTVNQSCPAAHASQEV